MSGHPMFTAHDLSHGAQQAVQQRGTPATLNLDDIFGDVMFTPDGDTVFLSEEQDALASGEREITTMASKVRGNQFVHVQKGGGLYTTQLTDREKPSLVMGSAASGVPQTAPVPYRKAPQERHHLQYALSKSSKKNRGSGTGSDRRMSEQQKVERRYVTILYSRTLESSRHSLVCIQHTHTDIMYLTHTYYLYWLVD